MDSSSKNSEMKRHAGEITTETSTSKILKVSSAVGAVINAQGNAKVRINTISVNQHIHQQQQIPEEPPRGIRLQLADPVLSFCGRDKELQLVKLAFNKPKNKKMYNLVVVCGYGGIGKTEFARKYLQQHQADFDNAIWIYAENFTVMKESFTKLQDELKVRGYPCSSAQGVYQHFNSDKCIFVFDNAENMQSICSFLPNTYNYSLFLITSQFKNWSPYESFKLDTLDLESATTIMKVVLDTHNIEISDTQLQTLVAQFEAIPLVLQIGAGFVCQEVIELKSIEKEYNIDNIIQALNSEFELVTQEFPPFSEDSYGKSVFKALLRTLQKVCTKQDKKSKLAADIIGHCAYLSAEYVHQQMLMRLLKIEDKDLFNKSLAALVQFSLIRISSYINMHRTVQECIRFYCREILKSKTYYLSTFNILLEHDYYYRQNQEVVLQRAESDIEAFCKFYNENKCTTLHEVLIEFVSCSMLEHLLLNCNIIENPEFLCIAAVHNRDDIMQLLRDRAVDFNVVDVKGFNALYYACAPRKHYTYDDNLLRIWIRIQALIKVGADANSRNTEGNTIIHSLCNMKPEDDKITFEMCTLIIKVGGDPQIENDAAKTPADLAREHGLPLTVQLLTAALYEKLLILHVAAECRLFKFVNFLSTYKICNLNEQDDSGQTVFHVLAGLTNQDVEDEIFEENLLRRITDILLVSWNNTGLNIVNSAGETAADVARRCGREKLMNLFNART